MSEATSNEGILSPTHSFDLADVEKYGSIEKALLVKEIRQMQTYKVRNGKQGWVYYSSKALSMKFPYMKRASIDRWLRELEESGALETRIKNKMAYDRTKSYRLPSIEESIAQNEQSTMQNEQSTAQSEQPIPSLSTTPSASLSTTPCVGNPRVDNSRTVLTYKGDIVSQLYYEVIKALGLPVMNHTTLKQKIEAMKSEAPEEDLILYLKFMRDKYDNIDIDYKPDVSTALDIYNKRIAIVKAFKRAAKRQTVASSTAFMSDLTD